MPPVQTSGLAAIALLIVTAALSGCSTEPAPASTATAEAAPAPKPTPTPEPMEWGVKCRILDDGYATTAERSFTSLAAAWAAGQPWETCEAFVVEGDTYTDVQRAAVAAAGYESMDSLDILYGLCAATGGFYVTTGPVSENQAKEAAGMLTLCPDFPGAGTILAASAAAQQAAAERAAGIRIGGGVFDVGTDVQPGRYQSTGPVENCYWERLDAAGEVIDNNFVTATSQVQVTVDAGDFSLHLDGCGELVRIE